MLRACRGVLQQSTLSRLHAVPVAWVSKTTTNTRDDLPGPDTHDDFKPQIKDSPTLSVTDLIKQDLENYRVMVYMKGEPAAPMCGFSNAACRILDSYGVRYGSRDVLSDPELREGIKLFSQWPTIPQVYVEGEFIGGCDLLMEMHKNGELESLFKSPN